MDIRQLKHDFQNNYLRLEVLLSIINDQLQSNQEIESKYLEDFEEFINLSKQHVSLIKSLQQKQLTKN